MLNIRDAQLHAFWIQLNSELVDWLLDRIEPDRPDLEREDLRRRIVDLLIEGLTAGKQTPSALSLHVRSRLPAQDREDG